MPDETIARWNAVVADIVREYSDAPTEVTLQAFVNILKYRIDTARTAFLQAVVDPLPLVERTPQSLYVAIGVVTVSARDNGEALFSVRALAQIGTLQQKYEAVKQLTDHDPIDVKVQCERELRFHTNIKYRTYIEQRYQKLYPRCEMMLTPMIKDAWSTMSMPERFDYLKTLNWFQQEHLKDPSFEIPDELLVDAEEDAPEDGWVVSRYQTLTTVG